MLGFSNWEWIVPNHFTTIGLCGRDYRSMEEMGIEEYDQIDLGPLEGANLCALVDPRPEELNGIISGLHPMRCRNKLTGEFWTKDSPSPRSPDWELVNLTGDEIAELTIKHGAACWYDWQCDRWGTKWGTYQTHVRQLEGDGSPVLIEFQSAWCPPNAATMLKIDQYLCTRYFLKDIKWIGHNPYDNSTCDIPSRF